MSGVRNMNLTWLEQAAQLTIVLGFCGAVFNYVVIHPIKESINRVGVVLGDIRDHLRQDSERLTRLEGEVAKIEQSVVTAHKRIDEFLQKKAVHNEAA